MSVNETEEEEAGLIKMDCLTISNSIVPIQKCLDILLRAPLVKTSINIKEWDINFLTANITNCDLFLLPSGKAKQPTSKGVQLCKITYYFISILVRGPTDIALTQP